MWRCGGQHADAGCNGVKLFQDVALDSRKVEVEVVVARLAGAKTRKQRLSDEPRDCSRHFISHVAGCTKT